MIPGALSSASRLDDGETPPQSRGGLPLCVRRTGRDGTGRRARAGSTRCAALLGSSHEGFFELHCAALASLDLAVLLATLRAAPFAVAPFLVWVVMA